MVELWSVHVYFNTFIQDQFIILRLTFKKVNNILICWVRLIFTYLMGYNSKLKLVSKI